MRVLGRWRLCAVSERGMLGWLGLAVVALSVVLYFAVPRAAEALVVSAADTSLPAPISAHAPAGTPGLTTSTLDVSGVEGLLVDVKLTTEITHAASGDLAISLVSPAGTRVELSNGNGGEAADVFAGTIWDDRARVFVVTAPYVDGVAQAQLRPEKRLANFSGEAPNGVWTLEINDSTPENDGRLNDWSLEIIDGLMAPIEVTLAGRSCDTHIQAQPEGSPIQFDVMFSREPSGADLQIGVRIDDGSATLADGDYRDADHVLSVRRGGDMIIPVVIETVADARIEPDEKFLLTLSVVDAGDDAVDLPPPVTGAAHAIGVISHDADAPTLVLSGGFESGTLCEWTAVLPSGASATAFHGRGVSIEDARAAIRGDFEAIFVWDADAQTFLSYRPDVPASLNTLTRIERWQNVVVISADPSGVEWRQGPAIRRARDVELRAGFNLVGWTGPDGASISDVVAGLGDAVESVFMLDGGSFLSYFAEGPPFVTNLESVPYSRRIWVKVTSDVTWTMPGRDSVGIPAALR